MIPRPPRSTRTATLRPYTPRFRSPSRPAPAREDAGSDEPAPSRTPVAAKAGLLKRLFAAIRGETPAPAKPSSSKQVPSAPRPERVRAEAREETARDRNEPKRSRDHTANAQPRKTRGGRNKDKAASGTAGKHPEDDEHSNRPDKERAAPQGKPNTPHH